MYDSFTQQIFTEPYYMPGSARGDGYTKMNRPSPLSGSVWVKDPDTQRLLKQWVNVKIWVDTGAVGALSRGS